MYLQAKRFRSNNKKEYSTHHFALDLGVFFAGKIVWWTLVLSLRTCNVVWVSQSQWRTDSSLILYYSNSEEGQPDTHVKRCLWCSIFKPTQKKTCKPTDTISKNNKKKDNKSGQCGIKSIKLVIIIFFKRNE